MNIVRNQAKASGRRIVIRTNSIDMCYLGPGLPVALHRSGREFIFLHGAGPCEVVPAGTPGAMTHMSYLTESLPSGAAVRPCSMSACEEAFDLIMTEITQ